MSSERELPASGSDYCSEKRPDLFGTFRSRVNNASRVRDIRDDRDLEDFMFTLL
jgi:hypothetical protein